MYTGILIQIHSHDLCAYQSLLILFVLNFINLHSNTVNLQEVVSYYTGSTFLSKLINDDASCTISRIDYILVVGYAPSFVVVTFPWLRLGVTTTSEVT